MLTKLLSLKKANISSHKRLKNKPMKMEGDLEVAKMISVAAGLGLQLTEIFNGTSTKNKGDA